MAKKNPYGKFELGPPIHGSRLRRKQLRFQGSGRKCSMAFIFDGEPVSSLSTEKKQALADELNDVFSRHLAK